jgi:protein O-mannosyl-transferase
MKVTAGLILAGVVLFGASLAHPFHFDDVLVVNDSNVTNPAQWAHFFHPLHLRQVTFFTFYFSHLVGGLNPVGFHAVNVAIHIANAVLLFFLLRRYFGEWIAAAAAAIFLIHPIQTEPVLYVYQRSVLLACFFSLVALVALDKGRIGWALLAFFLAFESKESAVAVPLALVALNRNVVAGFSPRFHNVEVWKRRLKPATTYLLLASGIVFAAAALVLLAYVNERTVGTGAAELISPWRYLLTQTRVLFTYLRLLVFPYPQSLEYEFQNAGGFLSVLGVMLLLFVAWIGRRSCWGLCIFAFLILLAPTSSIVPSADAAFEHRLYLPMLAFSVLVAIVLSKIPKRSWVTAVLLVILATVTVRRESVWASDVALWEDTVKHAPGKVRVWFNLGTAYLANDPEKAQSAFRRALELQPHFPEALYDLGVIEQGKRNWSVALAYYQRALEQQPDYWPAANNMGNTLFAMGDPARSVECFERTLRLNPDYWPAQYNIAIVHFMAGRYSAAAKRLRTVLDWQPSFVEARYLLATCLTQSGNRTAADREWKKLSEMNAAESRPTPTMILAPSRP